MGKPIHRDWNFQQLGNLEWLGIRIPGEYLEPEFRKTARCRSRAAVPRRRENGIRRCPKQLSQQVLAFFNVTALRRVVSCGAELTFLADGLVVDVRVAVLMNAQTFRMRRHAPRHFLRESRIQGSRYSGKINRNIKVRKDIQQQQEAIICPAAIIISEKQAGWLRKVIKRIAYWN